MTREGRRGSPGIVSMVSHAPGSRANGDAQIPCRAWVEEFEINEGLGFGQQAVRALPHHPPEGNCPCYLHEPPAQAASGLIDPAVRSTSAAGFDIGSHVLR
jgi:hypothetical protein